MSSKDCSPAVTNNRSQIMRIFSGICLLLIVSLSCNLPFSKKQTKGLEATATMVSPPAEAAYLPPTVVEATPISGSTLPLEGEIGLIFDQPMDKVSVEGAIRFEPAYSGRFEWIDESTVRFVSDQPFPPASAVSLFVDETAKSKNGLTLLRRQEFTYQTAADLRIAERFPADGLNDVDPVSTIALTFTQPVVAIGEDERDLPVAFSIQPSTPGSGRWLNSSTYIFKPDISLGGGVTYTVNVTPDLVSQAGSQLSEDDMLAWTFTTAIPKISWISPNPGSIVWLDEDFIIYFNQSMDRDSVEQNLILAAGSGEIVPTTFEWEEGNRQVIVTPSGLLPRASTIQLNLSTNARSLYGAKIGNEIVYNYQSVGALAVKTTDPPYGSSIKTYYWGRGSVRFELNAPIAEEQNLEELIKINPQPEDFNLFISRDGSFLSFNGYFESGQTYRITISKDLKDRWGGTFDQPFDRSFQVALPEPVLSIPMVYMGDKVLYLPAGENSIQASATGINRLDIRSVKIGLEDMVNALDFYVDPEGYQADRSWSKVFTSTENASHTIEIGLTPDNSELLPGLYGYTFSSPDLESERDDINTWVVVSQVQMTLKMSEDELFVWVTNQQSSVPGERITVYDNEFNVIGSATTDADGIVRVKIPPRETPFEFLVAVLGEPGDDNFSAGFSFWNQGITSWDYGLPWAYSQSDFLIKFFTDRPVYRPGQTVYFSGIVREPLDARYALPDIDNVSIEVLGVYHPETGEKPLIESLELPISTYGIIEGEVSLPEDASPGTYTIKVKDNNDSRIIFEVAEYRKPEIDLEVSFTKSDFLMGEDIHAHISASYFFEAPASDALVRWNLYARSKYIYLPEGYLTGLLNTSWLGPQWNIGIPSPLGVFLTSGVGRTDSDGRLPLTFTAAQMQDLLLDSSPVTVTLEATLVDESGTPVSQRAAINLHPADYYIGIRSESWGNPAGKPVGFAVQTVDWEKQPSGPHSLTAKFEKVVWKQDLANALFGDVRYTRELSTISSVDFQTDAAGQARLEFIPEQPGTYQLEVSGGGAVSQSLIWIGGKGSTPWPKLPNQHLRLEVDKQDYKAGETARIFIPNPYEDGAIALVTIERGNVLWSQVLNISGASQIVELEFDESYAPNIYVSVMLLGIENGLPDFRLGYLEVKVDPSFLELQVDLIPEDDHLEPGQTARAEIHVHDSEGNPVQGEFSLAVVDAAIYALVEPNVKNILEEFYGTQPLRVRNSTSLAAYSRRIPLEPPAMGGGGGQDLQVIQVRETFRDTAYWNASIETDSSGKAQIEFPVPDNLTTWVMTLRGTTRDTKVGQTVVNVVVSKELLVRPVTPRFLVTGDRVRVGAVVHNNTDQTLDVRVNLSAKGIELENPGQIEHTLRLAAHSSQRVDWWATVQNDDQAEMVFSAVGGGYQDATTPTDGAIPILHYSTPASFATNGMISEAGEVLEVVNLPRSYTPAGGELTVEMTTTLAGELFSGLEAMKAYPYDFTEPVLSRLFANLSVHVLLQEAEYSSPDLETQLQKEIRIGLDQLIGLQNEDGGWGYMPGAKSDLYRSSYALLVLSSAINAGFIVDEDLIDTVQDYVIQGLVIAKMAGDDWELNRLTMALYALKTSDYESMRVNDLYQVRDRLSPWAKALLLMSIGEEDAEKSSILLSDLQSSAIRSSTGAYWQEIGAEKFHQINPLANTAMVIYALIERDPASPLLTEAVRYVSLHRRTGGGWDSSYDSAWCIQALAKFLSATGELKGDFAFSANLNGSPVAVGQASGFSVSPVRGSTDINMLYTDRGNALRIQRDTGAGRLYYRAFLQLDVPVEDVQAVDKGIVIERNYLPAEVDCGEDICPAITEYEIGKPGGMIQAQVSVTLENDMYDLVVEDFIPAGTEISNVRLMTNQIGVPKSTTETENPLDLLKDGWGWWYFSSPKIFDDHIRWVASFIPAGTYILTYYLLPVQVGEFRVLPAHAYAYYFPEVEGRCTGEIFKIIE